MDVSYCAPQIAEEIRQATGQTRSLYSRSLKQGSAEKVAENVSRVTFGFRCAVAGEGTCSFMLPKMIPFSFAWHFLRQHPEEAEAKGFVEQAIEEPSEGQSWLRLPSRSRLSLLKARLLQVETNSTSDNPEQPMQSKKRKLNEDEIEPTSEELSCEIPTETVNEFDENVWIDAPSTDPAEYCRLCFSIAQPSEQVFSGPEDTESTNASLIEECTSIRLTAREDFPAAICQECCQKLHDIKCFRMLCETLNRAVCRNRVNTFGPKSPEIEAQVNLTPSTPPPLVPLTVDPPSVIDEVVELSDSDEDEDTTSDSPVLNDAPSAASVEEYAEDDDVPYIALQDDWFCCKQCNQIHQTLDVMIDHLQNNHAEKGFYRNPNAAPKIIKKKPKKRRVKTLTSTPDYQVVYFEDKPYFKCNDCDTLLSQKGNMNRHYQCYHTGPERARMYCTVPECHQSFMDSKGLSRHLVVQHKTSS